MRPALRLPSSSAVCSARRQPQKSLAAIPYVVYQLKWTYSALIPVPVPWFRNHAQVNRKQFSSRLERELTALYSRMDAAYTDKLDGKITEEFWRRKQADWQAEVVSIKSLIAGLEEDKSNERLLNVQRILELAQQAYFSVLYKETSGAGRIA